MPTTPLPLSSVPLVILEAVLNCDRYWNKDGYSSGTIGFSVEKKTRNVFIVGFVALEE
jgi:hypothetical protein